MFYGSGLNSQSRSGPPGALQARGRNKRRPGLYKLLLTYWDFHSRHEDLQRERAAVERKECLVEV